MLAQAVGARARLQQGSAARAPCLSGILDAIKASSLLDPDKSRLYRHAVGAALQRPLAASGTAASPAVPCCEQREDCELEAIFGCTWHISGQRQRQHNRGKSVVAPIAAATDGQPCGTASRNPQWKGAPRRHAHSDIQAIIGGRSGKEQIIIGVLVQQQPLLCS